jgi:hypothetical protein
VPSGCHPLDTLVHDEPPIASLYLPRTRTYLLLRSVGLPVLRGFLVLDADAQSLEAAARAVSPWGRMLVRSDPMKRGTPSIRGGDVWSAADLDRCAKVYLGSGRALMLFEPYERTANAWSFSILGGMSDCSFVMEIVGRGFDCGHLNRGQVAGHERYRGRVYFRHRYEIDDHTPFSSARYAADLADMRVPATPDQGEPMPAEVVSSVLRYYARVAPMLQERLHVLSGAVLEPGRRLTFWDFFETAQINR